LSDRSPDWDVVPSRSSPPELLPSHTPTCMGCGPDNPHGLHLVVYRSGDTVHADVTFDQRHIGAPGLAHGGAVAAACDDILGFTLWIAGTPAVTRSLTVEYLLPVPLHQPHRIAAHITAREGRALHVSGTGTGTDGVTRFTASAVFVEVSTEHFAAHGDLSGFGDLLEQFSRSGGPSTDPRDPTS
jgi:acyl-coenzyme A thioesterase PaaI-like protein